MNTIIYTIGFKDKSAEEFFTVLEAQEVESLIDIRYNADSHLNGFTRKKHLEFFLDRILNCKYIHLPILSPTKNLFNDYKNGAIDWPVYQERFNALIKERDIESVLQCHQIRNACLLCSEVKPDYCHRRLVAEYLQVLQPKIQIKHL